MGDAFLGALAQAECLPLVLAMPIDRRAARVAEAILADIAVGSGLDALVAGSGASLRTIQRRFLEETGMALSEWRQQARLIAGAGLLLDGRSVTDAALEAGYSGVSAFTHAFRCRIGQTPSQFRAAAAFGTRK
jgi:AraC-like DNA-binding protein